MHNELVQPITDLVNNWPPYNNKSKMEPNPKPPLNNPLQGTPITNIENFLQQMAI